MKLLSRDDILRAEDLPREEVALDAELYGPGAAVLVRTMTAAERADLEKRAAKVSPVDDPGGFRAAMLVATVVDAEGRPLFTAADAAALLRKNARTVETVFDAACRLNGFGRRDVEELEKN